MNSLKVIVSSEDQNEQGFKKACELMTMTENFIGLSKNKIALNIFSCFKFQIARTAYSVLTGDLAITTKGLELLDLNKYDLDKYTAAILISAPLFDPYIESTQEVLIEKSLDAGLESELEEKIGVYLMETLHS